MILGFSEVEANVALKWAALIVFGYLLGSVMFCNILVRKFAKKDIRKISKDGNPGAANVFWHCGWKLGMVGLVADVVKGIIPVALARLVMGNAAENFWEFGIDATETLWFSLVMIAPVLGHAFPIFEKFRGGKCISTSLGVASGLLGISPAFFILGSLDIFFSYIWKIKVGNARAVVFFSLFVLIMAPICVLTKQLAIFLGCAGFSAIAIYKHLPLDADEKLTRAKRVKAA